MVLPVWSPETCHHEAGHCVVTWYWGLPIYAVSLCPNNSQDPKNSGKVARTDFEKVDPPPSMRQMVREMQAAIMPSGSIAEAIYTGQSVPETLARSGAGDMDQMRAVESGTIDIPEAIRRACWILTAPLIQGAIKSLTSVLINEVVMGGDEVSRICRASLGRSRQHTWGHDKSSSQVSGISEHKGNDGSPRVQ